MKHCPRPVTVTPYAGALANNTYERIRHHDLESDDCDRAMIAAAYSKAQRRVLDEVKRGDVDEAERHHMKRKR